MWTPDAYQGAPTPITAYMSVGVKAAGFAVFIRLFHIAFGNVILYLNWSMVLLAVSVATMTLGNIVALTQTNLKRMLAYSSIAHAGYLLAAMVPGTNEAFAGILYYLMAYALMNLGAFGCIVLTAWKGHEGDDLRSYYGMGWEKPVMGVILSIFMFSLAGIPPTAGFLGKFYVFGAIIKAKYYWLAVLGILNSVVAVYYYLRVVLVMYMEPKQVIVHPDDRSIFARGPLVAGALFACAALTLIVGLWPYYIYGAALQSMVYILPKF
jgi:NADH-quinone oxidoreductase subunit N